LLEILGIGLSHLSHWSQQNAGVCVSTKADVRADLLAGLGDFNADRLPDVTVANINSNNLSVLINNARP
jgi:hypothetical protein